MTKPTPAQIEAATEVFLELEGGLPEPSRKLAAAMLTAAAVVGPIPRIVFQSMPDGSTNVIAEVGERNLHVPLNDAVEIGHQIEDATIERCAQVAAKHGGRVGNAIAAAIRALKDK